MAENYDALVSLVRDWSNRDAAALPDSVIRSGMRYAADIAYRELMIPPLENVVYYAIAPNGTDPYTNLPANVAQVNRDTDDVLRLPVPSDATYFIHLRAIGRFDGEEELINVNDDGSLVIEFAQEDIIFNEKTDIRTFHDFTAFKTSYNYWARQGDELWLRGEVTDGCVIELHYYRRLPALDARYNITDVADDDLADSPIVEVADGTSDREFNGVFYIGTEIPNWLRDENERVVLFGALWQCFDYLSDDEAQKYKAKFLESIVELNEEDKKRTASGGNIKINYSSNLL